MRVLSAAVWGYGIPKGAGGATRPTAGGRGRARRAD